MDPGKNKKEKKSNQHLLIPVILKIFPVIGHILLLEFVILLVNTNFTLYKFEVQI